jgi:hypothetical protein
MSDRQLTIRDDMPLNELGQVLVKRCPRCRVTKPIIDFSKSASAPDGHYGYCRDCASEKTRLWREAHPNAWKEWEASHPNRNQERLEKSRLKHIDPAMRHADTLKEKHHMSGSDYNSLLARQDGVCAICGTLPDGIFQVDHDHKTGRVRGLLCGPCNRGIGQMEDDPERLERAAKYLRGSK